MNWTTSERLTWSRPDKVLKTTSSGNGARKKKVHFANKSRPTLYPGFNPQSPSNTVVMRRWGNHQRPSAWPSLPLYTIVLVLVSKTSGALLTMMMNNNAQCCINLIPPPCCDHWSDSLKASLHPGWKQRQVKEPLEWIRTGEYEVKKKNHF